MKTNGSLVYFLYVVTKASKWFLSLVVGYLLIMACVALFVSLPQRLQPAFELPVTMYGAETYYRVENLETGFSNDGLEIKKANLAVLPHSNSVAQSLAYLHGAIYVAFWLAIIWCLSNIIQQFHLKTPFTASSSNNFKYIGWLVIGMAVYTFCVSALVAGVFSHKYKITNAYISPFTADINFFALFTGAALICLSAVFKKGKELQELEDFTV